MCIRGRRIREMALSTFRERCLKVATALTNGSIFGTMPQKANTRLILSFFTWTTDSENSSIYHRFVRSARTLLILHIAIASHRYPIIIHQQLGLFFHWDATIEDYHTITIPHYVPPHITILSRLGHITTHVLILTFYTT